MIPLTQLILEWYGSQARELPWRKADVTHLSVYAIWVAEIMLQQTRIETVIPYYLRWMDHFPTIDHLASASEHEVLKIWEGLGYYSRARNMLKTAQVIKTQFNGIFPQETKLLKRLPGIGTYTAAAIASIAYGKDEFVLDGNIRRVLARIYEINDAIGSAAAEKKFIAYAKSLLPSGKAGDFNQALMELGEVICIPRQPKCDLCPVRNYCSAFTAGVQHQLPKRKHKQPVPHYTIVAAVIQDRDKVLIGKRPANGLLGGLWGFPNRKYLSQASLEQELSRGIKEDLALQVAILDYLGLYRHAYTHFKISMHAFHCRIEKEIQEPQSSFHEHLTWVELRDLRHFPMSKVDRRIAIDLEHRVA